MIRKRISQSQRFSSLSKESQVVFCMLIPHYTPHGKMNGNPYFIKGEVMPFIKWATVSLIERCLKEISEKTSVKWFQVEGIWYLHSTNDQEHQTYQDGKVRKDTLPSYSTLNKQENLTEHKLQSYSRVTPELLQTKNGALPAIKQKQKQNRKAEQEAEAEAEIEQERKACAEMPKNGSSALPPELVMSFPCVGNPSAWHLTQAKLAEYSDTYPGVDVALECRGARQWCIDNERNRKTAGGMPSFLNRWLRRQQDKSTGHSNGNGRYESRAERTLRLGKENAERIEREQNQETQ